MILPRAWRHLAIKVKSEKNQFSRRISPGRLDIKNRILCIGVDSALLETRRQVLALHGYDAEIALPAEIKQIPPGHFDLLVVSVMVIDDDKYRIVRLARPDTRILILESLVLPNELLALIEGALTRRTAT